MYKRLEKNLIQLYGEFCQAEISLILIGSEITVL